MARVSPLMIAPPLVFVALAGLFFTSMMRDNADELPSTRWGRRPLILRWNLCREPTC